MCCSQLALFHKRPLTLPQGPVLRQYVERFFLYLHFTVQNDLYFFFPFVTFFLPFFKNVNRFYLLADLFLDFLLCSAFLYVSSRAICVFTYCISTVFTFLVAAGSLDKEEQSKPLVCFKSKKSESLQKTK